MRGSEWEKNGGWKKGWGVRGGSEGERVGRLKGERREQEEGERMEVENRKEESTKIYKEIQRTFKQKHTYWSL